jgi:peptide/nickel transport system substrate-binding protein
VTDLRCSAGDRRRSWRAALGATLLLLAGCGADRSGVLRVVMRTPVTSLDPQYVHDDAARSVAANLFDGLVTFTRDGGLAPALAASWSSPAENVWLFELRRGVAFHDGGRFEAEDVKYTLERGAARADAWVRSRLLVVAEVAADAPHRLRIRTRGPAPLLLNQLSEVAILRRGSDPAKSPVGTGPYRLARFSAGSEVVLTRFDGAWRGTPHWAGVVFRSDATGEKGTAQLLAGQADLVETPLGPAEGAGEAIRVLRHPGQRLAVLGLRLSPGSPFADPAARRAFDLGLDRRALAREAYGGAAEPAAQLAPDGVFGHLPERGVAEPDLASARKALAASRLGGSAAGTLDFASRDRRLADALARQAQALGLSFELNELDSGRLGGKLIAGTSTAFLMQVAFPNLDSTDLLDLALRTRSPDGRFGSLNFTAHSSPELDALLAKAEATLDPRLRYEVLGRAMSVALESRALIPLAVPDGVWAARRGIDWGGSPEGVVRAEDVRERP